MKGARLEGTELMMSSTGQSRTGKSIQAERRVLVRAERKGHLGVMAAVLGRGFPLGMMTLPWD